MQIYIFQAALIDIFVNCNWVVTRWQYTFTHKQYIEQYKTNNTYNTTILEQCGPCPGTKAKMWFVISSFSLPVGITPALCTAHISHRPLVRND